MTRQSPLDPFGVHGNVASRVGSLPSLRAGSHRCVPLENLAVCVRRDHPLGLVGLSQGRKQVRQRGCVESRIADVFDTSLPAVECPRLLLVFEVERDLGFVGILLDCAFSLPSTAIRPRGTRSGWLCSDQRAQSTVFR